MTTWLLRRRAQGAKAGAFLLAQVGRLDIRDWCILLGLALLWIGLRGVYPPLAPIAVGLFLLWFTTIRRVPE